MDAATGRAAVIGVHRRSSAAAFSRGSTSLQLLVILVPVLFGLMGFAIDLGRLYLVRGELNQAASAMALTAAARLIGTSDSTEKAQAAMGLAAHKYNFGSLTVGESTGLLASEIAEPAWFATAGAATGADTTSVDQADSTTARHVQVNLTAEAPLLFWSFLALGQQRKTSIAARAVAGISAPLCTVCGLEPLAIAARSQEDTTDFGFIPGTRYTFTYSCSAAPPNNPAPSPLPGTAGTIAFVLLNRFDAEGSTLDESQQLYRIGAQGLLPSTSAARACVTVGAAEQIWQGETAAVPLPCSAPPPAAVVRMACGLYSRFDSTPPGACSSITSLDAMAAAYAPDADTADVEDYTAYIGDTRRIITVPIVESLVVNATDTMNVVGFRQFLLEPNQGDIANNPADTDGRFAALYIGSVVPVKQGRMDANSELGCQITAGPGKVVLHQ